MINIVLHLINMGCDCYTVSIAMFSLWHQINTLTCLTAHALTVTSSWLNVMLYLLKLQLLLLFVATLLGQWILIVYLYHLYLRRTQLCAVWLQFDSCYTDKCLKRRRVCQTKAAWRFRRDLGCKRISLCTCGEFCFVPQNTDCSPLMEL